MSGVVSTDFVGVGVAGAATPPVPLELAGTAASSIAVSCAHTIARSAVSSSPTVGDELARRFAEARLIFCTCVVHLRARLEPADPSNITACSPSQPTVSSASLSLVPLVETYAIYLQ